MALTQNTSVDLIGQNQTITFNNPSQVDQISYTGGSIVFETSSTFNLTKSDLLLYLKYLNTFYNLLVTNFPALNAQLNNVWPLSEFDISETSAGVTHLKYIQSSQGTQVISINYIPQATACSFATRSSPVTISLQEFYMAILMLQQYSNQVSFN